MIYLDIVLRVLNYIGIISATFLIQIFGSRIFDIIYNKIIKRTRNTFDDEFFPLIQRLFGIFVWIIGLSLILVDFGFDLKVITASLGISSILISLLVKDSVTNIISGVTLMFDRPFKVGDIIRLPSGERGDVLKIGIRRTHILIEEHGEPAHLIINNADLSKCKIINFSNAIMDK